MEIKLITFSELIDLYCTIRVHVCMCVFAHMHVYVQSSNYSNNVNCYKRSFSYISSDYRLLLISILRSNLEAQRLFYMKSITLYTLLQLSSTFQNMTIYYFQKSEVIVLKLSKYHSSMFFQSPLGMKCHLNQFITTPFSFSTTHTIQFYPLL